jgi:hypothetical protein
LTEKQQSFWGQVLGLAKPSYDHQRLVDRKTILDPPWSQDGESSLHVISDIDKTYLETEFETLRKLLKTAMEKENKKSSVAGAPLFFRGLRKSAHPGNSRGADSLHFVSSSPPQMRSVLRSKFSMDGLEWESDTFKNQVYNIVRGRPGELKKHVAYKTTAILELCKDLPDNAELVFIGDNAEADPYIFAGLTLLIHGKIDKQLYKEFLLSGVVRRQSATEICRQDFAWLQKKNLRVSQVWIRRVKPHTQVQTEGLQKLHGWGLPLYYFQNFLDLSLMAARLGMFVYPKGLSAFIRRLINEFGYSREAVLTCFAMHLNKEAFARINKQGCLWVDLSAKDLREIDHSGSENSTEKLERKHLDELHSFCFE